MIGYKGRVGEPMIRQNERRLVQGLAERLSKGWILNKGYTKALFGTYEPLSKLLVSPLITPIVVPYIFPYISPFKEFRLGLI